ncbi:hypothetical protein PUMCH_003594 [Australozyma saopauloensis]|uniref:Actin interacting protein 3 C-terminal domain-containing protein n=1 Tax=Australozyma saopauloensis TaxID=291208 RepID=A0AAX4HCL7_9ASCO|nr:hypothetical protein PUMCH_003594 [[Candida] saopauloensis]
MSTQRYSLATGKASSRKRSSMSTIESSVTRLLVSTKHLLESLTQWARQEADDKFVSDAYVKLGNDFRAATRAFAAAGVDISDLGDVPRALRIVLESALSEAPTQENLDRFLPNIRNIIVNLLLSLKQKQSRAVLLAELLEKQQTRSPERSGAHSAALSARPSPLVDQHFVTEVPSLPLSPEVHATEAPYGNSSITVAKRGSANIAQDAGENSDSSMGASDRALAQLQKNNVILRRASKRFSAYQFAKLANFSGNQLPKLSAESNQTRDSVLAELKNEQPPAESHVEPSSEVVDAEQGSSQNYIFLRLKGATKKSPVQLPTSMTSLRLLFVEKFAYSPGVTSFPSIYIVDPRTSVSYELEESAIHDEIHSGSLIELKEHNADDVTMDTLNSKILSLEKQMLTISSKIIEQVGNQISQIELNQRAATPIISQDSTVKASDVDHLKLINQLQQEVNSLKQSHRAKTEIMKTTLTDLTEQLAALKLVSLESSDTSQNSHRTFMQHSYARLSEESDSLLTKVDDLQDMMEDLRKDVAQRGVRLGSKQLSATAKEIADAEDSLQSLVSYIHDGKPSWKKIWEAELDKVCEEQQFFNLQDDLTRDLNEDINKIRETFELIEKCCSEQSKQPQKKTNFANRIPLMEPGESIHGLKDAVLNEVNHLVPDHASRLDAIARAERIRKKEREAESLNEFQEELGGFVADQKLKKSGGIEEVERMRQERDLENFKSTFGVV